MANNKIENMGNILRFNPKYLESRIITHLKHFGSIDKVAKDFTFDEIADWYLHTCHPKSQRELFIGIIPPNYKFPYTKEFPQSPLLDSTENDIEDEE